MGTLFRPVGLNELALIWDMEFRGFPPRLAHQPYFYPVTNADYARQIAAEWNIRDEASGFAGFVTRFEVANDYLTVLQPHVAGAKTHAEYWIPAEELGEFNHALVGSIGVEEAFFGPTFVGWIPEKYGLRGKNAVEQFVVLAKTFDYSLMDFLCEISANCKAVYLNSCFWVQHDFTALGFDSVRRATVTDHLREAWLRVASNKPLPPVLRKDVGEAN